MANCKLQIANGEWRIFVKGQGENSYLLLYSAGQGTKNAGRLLWASDAEGCGAESAAVPSAQREGMSE
jgi:hypothetical protein